VNLADPATLQRFLAKQGLSATKGLGQHFLCSEPVVDCIVERLSNFHGLLEIGPGPGVLTAPLSERAEKMLALEVDVRMIKALATSAPKAEVLKLDALQADLPALLSTLPERRAVVSNLPYYITAPLLNVIAKARTHFEVAVLMMQKEVAKRIMAPPRSGDRGSLSVYLQAEFEISHVVDAPSAAFFPPPKVDSTVLEFKPKSNSGLDETFFDFVRLCFNQPRKTLVNNLVVGLHVSRDAAVNALQAAELTPLARAQELTQSEFVRLRAVAIKA
jgi:16S rRNA (adenine1518-N6/adenine1519-N6)-dimethyltransferase